MDYLISILVSEAFLAALLKHIGMSAALVGILSAMVSLACVAQLAAALDAPPTRRVKRWLSLRYLLNGLTAPANGRVMYALHMLLYAMAMAGVNGGLVSIAFDYVPYQDRAKALGIKAALGGVAGFLATLAGGRVVGLVQALGNQMQGHTVYAQRLLSIASGLGMLLLACYALREECRCIGTRRRLKQQPMVEPARARHPPQAPVQAASSMVQWSKRKGGRSVHG